MGSPVINEGWVTTFTKEVYISDRGCVGGGGGGESDSPTGTSTPACLSCSIFALFTAIKRKQSIKKKALVYLQIHSDIFLLSGKYVPLEKKNKHVARTERILSDAILM